MGEFRITGQGELDLGLQPPRPPRPAARPPRPGTAAGRAGAAPRPGDSQPEDDWADGFADDLPDGLADDWEPGDEGDPETDPDDFEAWLAGLPAGVRAEYLAGPWTGAGESIPAGFLHHVRGGPAGTGFAAGGALDTMPPSPWLADALTAATAQRARAGSVSRS